MNFEEGRRITRFGGMEYEMKVVVSRFFLNTSSEPGALFLSG
jgi:hypothetical protein